MRLILVLVYVLITNLSRAQDSTQQRVYFDEAVTDAKNFRNEKKYEEVEESYRKAITIANAENWNWELLNTKISLAEHFRSVTAFSKGLDILYALEGLEHYPDLQTRQLGRIAAIHHERSDLPIGLGYLDSVKFYLDSAIKVCVENDVREHLPTLLREQGLVYVESSMHDTGRSLLMNAADVFIAQGDTENYVGTLVHVSRSFNNEKIYSKSDSLSRYLWNIVKSRNWYSIKLSLSELFESIALVNEDSISFLKWKLISKEQLFLRSQETMAFKDYKAFNEMHLLNKSKSDFLISKLEEKEEALYLKEEAAKKNRFLFYFILSGTIALTIGLLFFRERTLKRRIYRTNKSLSKANDNYRLLMLESNHRIKNNLQMILSLVRYAKINQGKKGDVIIDDLSNKIHVISSLHEQLTMSSHGEEVDLKVYIETIVNHYKRFSILEKKVDLTLDSVEINNERIVYFGLILNELLSNTIAHSKSNSEINIKLIKKENKFLFFYSDGSNFENSKMTGTGTELIKELLDRIQVSETIMNKKTGTYSFKFSA